MGSVQWNFRVQTIFGDQQECPDQRGVLNSGVKIDHYYSGLPLIWPPLGPIKVSCVLIRGVVLLRGWWGELVFNIEYGLFEVSPEYRGGYISGVQIRASSL